MWPNGCRLGLGVDKSDISMQDRSSLEIGIMSEDVLMLAEQVWGQAVGVTMCYRLGSGVDKSNISM